MTRVVVTGASSPLGTRVVSLLAARDDVDQVVAVDVYRPVAIDPAKVRPVQLDLVTAELGEVLEGADAVVHLATVFGPSFEGEEIDQAVDVVMARRLFDASAKADVDHLVVLSSATVYGPWANNPVPLTEEAPLRPHPDLAYAVQKAEIERLAAEYALDRPSATVARLRPAPIVHEGVGGWLAQALDAAADLPTAEETPAQYVHVDDVAAAVVAVWSSGLDGAINVAPSGWLTPTERRELDPVPKVRLPEPVAVALSAWRWRLRLAPTAPGILAYARHPWVVANDRLADTGWEASNSNEEAYVAGHEASVIETISPRRRQELALGIAGVAVAASVIGVVALVRSRRRRAA